MAVTPNLHLLLLVAFLLLAAAPPPSAAEKFVVGDKKNWAANVNYTTWPDQYHFHVGDWLQFNYARDMYDVVQVANQTAYDKCDPSNPLVIYNRGRGFVFQLNHTGRYYFICSRGYCWSGMKVTVLVEDSPAQPPRRRRPTRPRATASSRGPSPPPRPRSARRFWVCRLRCECDRVSGGKWRTNGSFRVWAVQAFSATVWPCMEGAY